MLYTKARYPHAVFAGTATKGNPATHSLKYSPPLRANLFDVDYFAIHPNSPKIKYGWKMKRILVLIFVALIVGCSKKPDHPTQVGAYAACQHFVKLRLKSPGSADFDGYDPSLVKELKKVYSSKEIYRINYLVAGYVSASNSFGVKQKTAYTCMVSKKTGEDWKLSSVNLD